MAVHLKEEIREKENRIRNFVGQNNLDMVLLMRQDNFAWFTCGGDNRVLITSETGASAILISSERKYLVSYFMDGYRLINEDLEGQGFDAIIVERDKQTLTEVILTLIKGLKVGADTPFPETTPIQQDISRLWYPLTCNEIDRYKCIAAESGEVLEKVANEVEPGETEYQIAGRLAREYFSRGFIPAVMLVGTDERVFKYRHPLPANKTLEKYLLLAPAVRKYGLHVLNSRLVHFGEIPQEIKDRHNAVAVIHANMIDSCIPGKKYVELTTMQKSLFTELGYGDEWGKHFQGGTTGYEVSGTDILTNANASIQSGQAFGWYITITGVKSEETSLLEDDKANVITNSPNWPGVEIPVGPKKIHIPDILIK